MQPTQPARALEGPQSSPVMLLPSLLPLLVLANVVAAGKLLPVKVPVYHPMALLDPPLPFLGSTSV